VLTVAHGIVPQFGAYSVACDIVYLLKFERFSRDLPHSNDRQVAHRPYDF
jgi:hypothetical protein